MSPILIQDCEYQKVCWHFVNIWNTVNTVNIGRLVKTLAIWPRLIFPRLLEVQYVNLISNLKKLRILWKQSLNNSTTSAEYSKPHFDIFGNLQRQTKMVDIQHVAKFWLLKLTDSLAHGFQCATLE